MSPVTADSSDRLAFEGLYVRYLGSRFSYYDQLLFKLVTEAELLKLL